MHKSNAVILSPETAGTVGVLGSSLSLLVGFSILAEAIAVAWSAPHCGRFLLAPLSGNKEGSKRLIDLRVKATPTWFPTNSLYIPMDNTPMHPIPSVLRPWGVKTPLMQSVM